MRDRGEIRDYVERKGPISYDEICNNTPMYPPDEIFEALTELEDRDKLRREEGSLEEHGTTREVWMSNDD